MPSISELRKKIKGIKSTKQITSAMKMVAGARFARAQREMVASTVFPRELEPVVRRFLQSAELNRGTSPYIVLKNSDIDQVDARIGLVVITGDKGLCGDFNSAVLREADKFRRNHENKVVNLFAIGKKAADYARKSGLPSKDYVNLFTTLNFEHADKIGDEIMQVFAHEHLTQLHVIFSEFKSSIRRTVEPVRIFPISVEDASTKYQDTEVEPIETDIVLKTVVPQWLKSRLYTMMRNSYAAELAARMAAMDNATRNAKELTDTMTLEMNKVRQSAITREIAEITGTSEVMQE